MYRHHHIMRHLIPSLKEQQCEVGSMVATVDEAAFIVYDPIMDKRYILRMAQIPNVKEAEKNSSSLNAGSTVMDNMFGSIFPNLKKVPRWDNV